MKQIIQAIKGVKEKKLEDCRTAFEEIIKEMKTK